MRNIVNFNHKWAFAKVVSTVPAEISPEWNWVNLPHSWNAIDGQDGGNDYFRGTCQYAKSFTKAELPEGDRYYLEIQGANSSADVTLNAGPSRRRLLHLACRPDRYAAGRKPAGDQRGQLPQ